MLETDRLAELISEKREVLARLWQLTERQGRLLSQNELTSLMSLLAAKQALLSRLQALERQLDPFREQEPDQRRWRSAEFRERTRQHAGDCEQLLASIIRVERQCESQLIERRDETSHRLQGAHHAAHARTEYLRGVRASASQLDLSSES